jgi:O-antigen/teichoic acid export membrane protein
VKLPKFIRNNLILKITSLNAVVITIRLVVSIFIQRLLAITVGEAGIANIGQVRNLVAMLTSTSTLGTFSGVVKYVAEFKESNSELNKFFSTATLFAFIGSLTSALILFFGSKYFSNYVFNSDNYIYVFQLLAVIVPFIAINRMVSGVVNGLSDYKRYAKIELVSYLLATVAIVIGLYTSNLKGVIIAIAIAPVIQLIVLGFVFGKVLKKHLQLKGFKFNLVYKNQLLAFTLMSFVSAFLINFIELDIRTLVANKLNINEAGYWTAITFISKNYMVFATGLFTLYILPKFASIHSKSEFIKEVLHIYKSILPLFGLGMILVYLLRSYIIKLVYPEFEGMEPLFKWQLLGDFIRLAALVLSYQFLAKKLVRSFVFTELVSLALFYILTQAFLKDFGTEGVVIAHFVRSVICFVIIAILVWINMKRIQPKAI